MSPVPTVVPSGIKSLPSSLTGTASPDTSSASSQESGGISFDPSTIAAISLGIALFFTIAGIIAYCIWINRKGRRHYKPRNRGESGQWTVIRQGSNTSGNKKRESLLPTYVKRLSMSKPTTGIDVTRIGPPTLIHSQNHGIAEPKAAYIPPGIGPHKTSLDSQARSGSVDFATTEKFVKADRRVTVDLTSQPNPVSLRVDTKRRPTPPQLLIPTSSKSLNNGAEAITQTTVGGLAANIYVPPTPSRTQFTDPFARRSIVRPPGFDYFSPNDVQAYPSPPPKDRQRFSDPLTPTPASMRSVRSLSWNGNGVPQSRTPALQNNSHPEWLYTSATKRRTPSTTPIEPDGVQHNWIPLDVERDSMETHAHSTDSPVTSTTSRKGKGVASTVFSYQSTNPSHFSRVPPVNVDESDAIDTDDESIIDSEYESSDETSTVSTPKPKHRRPRSSMETGRSLSTRFSQESMQPGSRLEITIERGNPAPGFLSTGWKKNEKRPLSPTPPRPLSSPALEIVTKPGAESPPYSPVTFRIDNNPLLTPKPSNSSPPLSRQEVDDDSEDDSYPAEWKAEMDRIAAEEDRQLKQQCQGPHGPSPLSRSTIAAPASSKVASRKSVSFALDQGSSTNAEPVSQTNNGLDTGSTVNKIRPSWYVTTADGTKMGMF
ncbi:hypothetical protein ABW19_dt0208045 [Dactylella cylindrospora]|nr:hypothetical protein ABW19_dt0208045 [Dactylella cylindrospora]